MYLFKNRKGFTLMEVIVSMAILAILAAPLLQTFLTSARVGQHSYDIDKANTVSVQTVEAIKGNPAEVLSSDFTYTESSAEGQLIHQFTRTRYYDANWNGPSPDSSLPFRVLTSVSGKDASGTGLDSLSYVPQLISQADSKEHYHIEVPYPFLTSGSYELQLVSDGSQYTLSASSSVLQNTKNGHVNASSVQIPAADCVSGIVPIVLDVGTNPGKEVSFRVNNQTNVELGFYIYGDNGSSFHWVSAVPTSGVLTVSYMKPRPSELKFDKLEVNVKVFRQTDSSQITNYTTMVYLPG